MKKNDRMFVRILTTKKRAGTILQLLKDHYVIIRENQYKTKDVMPECDHLPPILQYIVLEPKSKTTPKRDTPKQKKQKETRRQKDDKGKSHMTGLVLKQDSDQEKIMRHLRIVHPELFPYINTR